MTTLHAVPASPVALASPSLEAAFRQYSRYVAAIALRLCGRDEVVDDIVQEVFLAAVRGLAELREPAAIKGWLATVTVRITKRHLRMRRLRGFLRLDESPDYGKLATEGTSGEQRALLAEIYGELDKMSVEWRVAWTLRYVEGESLEQVASLCGCSLATAKRRIAAAQAHLEQVVEHG